jgi:prepilin-type N-terminal cleavage/methylation domain-containing protein
VGKLMRTELRHKRQLPPHSQLGFTLVEILVVLAIIFILVGICTQSYLEYKQRSFDARAVSDLRSIASAEEAHFISTESYISCTGTGCIGSLPGISTLSDGVLAQVTATATGFIATSRHSKGTGVEYTWSTSAGGLQNP